uniref:Uncharacterized protein n=1 Tax=Anguilla anguilla TaxID=7936 RepID=A0A0E9PXQ8_ANGAN
MRYRFTFKLYRNYIVSQHHCGIWL